MSYKKPKRFFEKSGLVDPSTSFYVQLENVTNMDNQDLKTMVDRGRYFSIFAPRLCASSRALNPVNLFIVPKIYYRSQHFLGSQLVADYKIKG